MVGSSLQCNRVVCDVLTNEAFDEVIAVVIAGLQAQFQRMARFSTRSLQQLRLQLVGEEFIGIALVHQQRQALDRFCNQCSGVVGFPCSAIFTQVRSESLFAPRRLRRRNDR